MYLPREFAAGEHLMTFLFLLRYLIFKAYRMRWREASMYLPRRDGQSCPRSTLHNIFLDTYLASVENKFSKKRASQYLSE